MKIIKAFSLVFLLTITFCSVSQARYRAGFKVLSKTENSVTIISKKGEEVTIEIDSKLFSIGEEVKYNAEKKRVQKIEKGEGC